MPLGSAMNSILPKDLLLYFFHLLAGGVVPVIGTFNICSSSSSFSELVLLSVVAASASAASREASFSTMYHL